jgi:hypothetical protein
LWLPSTSQAGLQSTHLRLVRRGLLLVSTVGTPTIASRASSILLLLLLTALWLRSCIHRLATLQFANHIQQDLQHTPATACEGGDV